MLLRSTKHLSLQAVIPAAHHSTSAAQQCCAAQSADRSQQPTIAANLAAVLKVLPISMLLQTSNYLQTNQNCHKSVLWHG